MHRRRHGKTGIIFGEARGIRRRSRSDTRHGAVQGRQLAGTAASHRQAADAIARRGSEAALPAGTRRRARHPSRPARRQRRRREARPRPSKGIGQGRPPHDVGGGASEDFGRTEAAVGEAEGRRVQKMSVRRLFAGLVIALVLLGVTLSAQADRAAPRADQNSIEAHRQLIDKARRGGIDVYFTGDSIVRRWGATDYPDLLANWQQNFFGWNAANFGWGADQAQHVLWRLENGELDGVNPKIVVVLAGTNKLGATPYSPTRVDDVTRGLTAIVDACRRKAPAATIILTGIFPRNDDMALLPEIDRINTNLARLADGVTVRFLSVNDKLADKDGRLFQGVMNERDKLHPSIKGYQVWADALKPIFRELLGPPASTDHAPPPTGDPSARGRSGRSQAIASFARFRASA